LQHPFKKLKPVKSRVSEDDFKKCGKQETGSQEKFREIYQDLQLLKKLGVSIYSVTCDGHKAILKAIRKAFPEAIIQRCLVHIKRQVRHLSLTPF
jgi:transposase-like protein